MFKAGDVVMFMGWDYKPPPYYPVADMAVRAGCVYRVEQLYVLNSNDSNPPGLLLIGRPKYWFPQSHFEPACSLAKTLYGH